MVICLDGLNRNKNKEHGKTHEIYDKVENALGLAGTPKGTTELLKLEAAGAASVAAVTKCNVAELMTQLRTYHQLKGMGPDFKVRADPTGALSKGKTVMDFVEKMTPGTGAF